MMPAEFINLADAAGGPERLFDAGLTAADIFDETVYQKEFKRVVADYWMAYQNLREFRDRYYDFVEMGHI